jgi:hypothetical protein
MKRKFSRRYQSALLAYLKQGPKAQPATGARHGPAGAGRRLQTLDLAKLHEQILVTEVLPGIPAGKRSALIKQAGAFFTEAITPIEKIHRSAHEAAVHLKKSSRC